MITPLEWLFDNWRMKRPQSSLAMDPTELPFELVTLIFQNLNSQDLRSARLVSRDWEANSRSCFASKHFSRTIFWLTSSGLRNLDQISRKFGSYMRTVNIAADRFTIAGLVGMFKQYLHDRRKTRKYNIELQKMIPTSYSVLDVKIHHLRQYFKHQRWPYSQNDPGIARFFWNYSCNIFSQWWLRSSGRDVSTLAAVLGRVPQCDVKVVTVSYEISKLQSNALLYGKPAPEHAFELALFLAGRNNEVDTGYSAQTERIVEEACERRHLYR